MAETEVTCLAAHMMLGGTDSKVALVSTETQTTCMYMYIETQNKKITIYKMI